MITRSSMYDSAPRGARPTNSIRQVCRTLYRHKRKMAVVFCMTLSLVVLGLIAFPWTYTSEARLLVRLGRESVGLDPTATLNQTISVNGTREHEINSEIEILRSRVLLEDVVEQIGHEAILGAGGNKAAGWTSGIGTAIDAVRTWFIGEVGPRERAVTHLERTIGVSSPRKSNMIVVTCKSYKPELAQQILGAYLDAYEDRHVTANRTSGSHQFFVDQSDLLREQLTLATAQLRDVKNENVLASVEGQRANVEAQVNAIETAILENQRLLSASDAKIAALKTKLTALPEKELAEESMIPSAAADSMRNELYKVQILEKEASSRFTALHPRVIALRRQVDETRKILATEDDRRNHPTHKLNTVHQAVQTELATAEAAAAAYQAESVSLAGQLDTVRQKVRLLNNNEMQVTELARKVDLLESSYNTYAANREQARINEALEIGRISNVNPVQTPSFVAKPSSPRIGLTLLLGFFVATMASVLAAFTAEYFDRSIATADQVEQELGIPVLFSVSRGVRHELIKN